MSAKKTMVYTKVPEPVPGSIYRVECADCGTNSMTDMNNHKDWCALAKKKMEAAKTQKAKSQKRGPKRR